MAIKEIIRVNVKIFGDSFIKSDTNFHEIRGDTENENFQGHLFICIRIFGYHSFTFCLKFSTFRSRSKSQISSFIGEEATIISQSVQVKLKFIYY